MERSGTRVLFIPELLDMIFGFLDRHSNATNAQVCKSWMNIALDVLWKDVTDLPRLLVLLSPLKSIEGKNYEFEHSPDVDDWKRFEKYASRVRRLKYYNSTTPPLINQNVFDDIARTRRRLEILPNLHTLEWKAPIPNLCIPFMHSGIKKFTIIITTQEVRPFFHDIADRMPNLVDLDLTSCVPLNVVKDHLVQLVSQLPKLHKIILPRFHFTTRVAEALSRLQHLSIIEFQVEEGRTAENDEETQTFAPGLTEGAFPSLYDLSMTTHYDDVTQFIEMPFAPSNLTMLYVESDRIYEESESVHKLISAVSKHCQLVKHLALISRCDPFLSNEDEADEDEARFSINLQTLKPLFQMPNLVHLQIGHQYPLLLALQDIKSIASSCPSIETLLLNPDPIRHKKSNLTLEALLPLAEHCPNLKELGLFLDATKVPEASPTTLFRSLRLLSIGMSIIEDETAPALYLSQILMPECDVESGVTWGDFGGDARLMYEVRVRCMVWERVNNMMPMLTKLRHEERQRTRAMKLELEDLRMRTAVLRDTAAMGVRLDLSTCILI